MLRQEPHDLAIGVAPATRTARGKSQRNGTSGITAATRGSIPATASEMPPPWLPPHTATRAGSIMSSPRSASIARTPSVNTRR